MKKNIEWVNNYNHGFRYHYVVDEANRKVTCIMEARYNGDNFKGADMFMYKRLKHEMFSRNVNMVIRPDQHFVDKLIKGVAYCSSEDVFDADIGRRIAYHKALKKLSEHRVNEMSKLTDYYNKVADALNTIYQQQKNSVFAATEILSKFK